MGKKMNWNILRAAMYGGVFSISFLSAVLSFGFGHTLPGFLFSLNALVWFLATASICFQKHA
jgi:hypothetical protein